MSYELDDSERYDFTSEDELYAQFEEAAERLREVKGITDNLNGDIEEYLLDMMFEIMFDVLDETTSIESVRNNFVCYARQYSQSMTNCMFLALRAKVMADYPLLEERCNQSDSRDYMMGDALLD